MATQPKKERVLEIVYGDGRVSKLPMPTPSPLEAKPKRATRTRKVVKAEPEEAEEVKPKRTRTKKTVAAAEPEVKPKRTRAKKTETTETASVVAPIVEKASKENHADIVKVADAIISTLDPNLKRIVRNTSATASTSYKIDKNTKETNAAVYGMWESSKESYKVQTEILKVAKEIESNTGGGFGDIITKGILGALGPAGLGAAGAAAGAGAKALGGKVMGNAAKAGAGEVVPRIAGKAEQEALQKTAQEALKKSEQQVAKTVAKRIGVKAAAKGTASFLGSILGGIGGTIVGSPIVGAAAAVALPVAIEAGFDYIFGEDEPAPNADSTPTAKPTGGGISEGLEKDQDELDQLFGPAPKGGGVEITVPPRTDNKPSDGGVGLFNTPKATGGAAPVIGGVVGYRGEGGGADAAEDSGGGAGDARFAKLSEIRQDRISQLEAEIKQKEQETQKKFEALTPDGSSSEDTRDAMESQSVLEDLKDQLGKMKDNFSSRIEDPKEADQLDRIFGKPLNNQAEILTKGLLDSSGQSYLSQVLDVFKDLATYLAFGGKPGSTGGQVSPSIGGGSSGGGGGSIPKVTGSIPAPTGLGSLSAQYESGREGSAAIGNDSTGGYSYGKYQLSTKRGSMQNFMNSLQQKNPEAYAKLQAAGGMSGASAGTPEFKAAWKEASQMPGFSDVEHDVMKQNNYDPAVSKMQDKLGFDPTQRSKTLQDVVWSTSVQHGGSGANDVFTSAQKKLGKPLSQATDDEIINAVYDVRPNFFSKSTDKERASVNNRFKDERQNALGMLANEKSNPGTASVPGAATGATDPASAGLVPAANPAIPPVPETPASQGQNITAAPSVVHAPTTTNVINNGGGSQVAPVRLSSRNDENTVERLQAAYLYHGVIF